MQQPLKMTVFCVSHTQVAVLKLEGVKEGEGKRGGFRGWGILERQ